MEGWRDITDSRDAITSKNLKIVRAAAWAKFRLFLFEELEFCAAPSNTLPKGYFKGVKSKLEKIENCAGRGSDKIWTFLI